MLLTQELCISNSVEKFYVVNARAMHLCTNAIMASLFFFWLLKVEEVMMKVNWR